MEILQRIVLHLLSKVIIYGELNLIDMFNLQEAQSDINLIVTLGLNQDLRIMRRQIIWKGKK